FGGGISSQIIFIILFFVTLPFSRKRFTFKDYHFILYLYWVVLTLSTFFSPYVELRRDLITFFISMNFFIFATALDFKKNEIDTVLNTYVLTAVFSSLSTIYNFINNNTYNNFYNRFSPTFFGVDKDPNYTIAFLVPAILILLFNLSFRKHKTFKLLSIVI